MSLGFTTASGAETVALGESSANVVAPVEDAARPTAGAPAESDSENETVALDQSPVNAVGPARELGKPAAAPRLLKVQAHAEALGAEPVLVPLGAQDAEVPRISRVAALPVADDRGPPVRQAF